MFKHIVLYKLRDRSDAEEMKKKFESMVGSIPQIVSLQSGIDSVCSPRSFDISLCVDFKTENDYLIYKDHPYHVNNIVPFVHSVIEKAVSVDYEY